MTPYQLSSLNLLRDIRLFRDLGGPTAALPLILSARSCSSSNITDGFQILKIDAYCIGRSISFQLASSVGGAASSAVHHKTIQYWTVQYNAVQCICMET